MSNVLTSKIVIKTSRNFQGSYDDEFNVNLTISIVSRPSLYGKFKHNYVHYAVNYIENIRLSPKARYIEPMLGQCWLNSSDAWPTLTLRYIAGFALVEMTNPLTKPTIYRNLYKNTSLTQHLAGVKEMWPNVIDKYRYSKLPTIFLIRFLP